MRSLLACPSFAGRSRKVLGRGLISRILALVIAGFVNPTISAQTHDAENGFSTVSNPTPGGVWTYGWSDDLNSPLVVYPQLSDGVTDSWYDPNNADGFLTPLVEHNPNDTPSGPHPPHSLSLHPSGDGDYSHVRFTAPVAGLFSVTASFSQISGATTDVHIVVNNALPTLFSGYVSGADGDEFSSAGPIALAAGGTIDFAVGFGDNGHIGDSTRLEATITLVDDCPADMAPRGDGDDVVNVQDLLALIGNWGACPTPGSNCPADLNSDGSVNVADLLALIGAWGACP